MMQLHSRFLILFFSIFPLLGLSQEYRDPFGNFDDLLDRQSRSGDSFDDFLRRGNDGKEWTMLVFMNGNNNLDPYTEADINEMEDVGSSAGINVVVQWASIAASSVKRLYIQKDNEPRTVTSPVVEDIGATDMGNWKNLEAFVKWGIDHYPAKKYFVVVWNHGSGWHDKNPARNGSNVPMDISLDEKTGHIITTEELGRALVNSSKYLGRKIDVYGSDACLMQMAEVNAEMSPGVDFVVGSQQTEPGTGWDYSLFLKEWTKIGFQTGPRPVVIALGKAYKEASVGTHEITLSSVDLSKRESFEAAFSQFSLTAASRGPAVLELIKQAAGESASFYYSDYIDFGYFLKHLDRRLTDSQRSDLRLQDLQKTYKDYIVSNDVSEDMEGASGLSFWIPQDSWTFERHRERYSQLSFAQKTRWDQTLSAMFSRSVFDRDAF